MQVITGYRFTPLTGLAELGAWLRAEAERLALRGTILLAEEGVNLSLCGQAPALARFLEHMQRDQRLADLPVQRSDTPAPAPAFDRLKVRIKPEILTFGQRWQGVETVGEPVSAARWNQLLDDSEVTVVDVRNRYETQLGAFPGALDPGTDNFREFPAFAEARLHPDKHARLALYCTGGIRCEKASAWLRQAGFAEVYQLAGGILRYLTEVDAADCRWQGQCFVFDKRESLSAGAVRAEAAP